MRGAAFAGAFACVLAAAGCAPEPFHGIELSPASDAPPLVAARTDGGRFALADLEGRVVALYFGYTHCPDVCPTVMADWARAKRALAADSAAMAFVFVSVDPGRDTPADAHTYATQFDPGFVGVGITDAELALVLRDWGIAAYPEGDPRTPDYTVAHPAHTFVVDARGKLRLMIPPGVRGEQMAADLRRLQ